jgi:hypothetical protein
MTAATSVSVTVRRDGGRKLVVTPDGRVPASAPSHTRTDPAVVRALART